MKNKISKFIKSGVAILLFGFLISGIKVYAQDESAMGISDGEILATIIAVDQHEIDVSEVVQKREVEMSVMSYAQMLYMEHSNNKAIADSLVISLGLAAEDNDEITAMKQKVADDLTKLASLTGEEFEAAYIDAMIKGHKEVINMIDTKLLPAVTNEQVKFFLIDTRSHVQMHLDEANKLK